MVSVIRNTELINISSFDDYMLNIKVDWPDNPKSIVIFCHGSGPNTYDNYRKIDQKEFNYYDLFADEFCKRGIAFCRWNTRGCTLSNNPPDYISINKKEYGTYCPTASISDILWVGNYIKEMPQFRNSKIIFMGISEGSTLIPFAAYRFKNVAALLLLSFSYGNMKDTMEWQLNGGSSMVNMLKWFDYNGEGFITRSNFQLDKYNVRPYYFPETCFEDLDLDGDGVITQKDFEILLSDYRSQVFAAINSNDDEWLWNNYDLPLTSKWFKGHFALPRVAEALNSLDMPIHIFQGEGDENIPFSDIDKIRNDFRTKGKNNLRIHTFANHDHNLNYLHFPLYGQLSEGLSSVFEIADNI